MSLYQVSDKVPSKVITGVTSNCSRENCQLSARMGESTMMGTSEYYDKAGILHIHDPNRFQVELCCGTCWKEWQVNQNGEVVKIIKE